MRVLFEDCEFDPETREVLRSGRAVSLSPKAFHLLEVLVRERPKAVDRRKLHAELWPGIFVTDANLPNLVAELRSALRDNARKPHIIRTIRGFGYAFGAQTRARQSGGAPPSGPAYRLLWGDREIALGPGENVIGRLAEAIVWIDDASVSRRHARVVVGDDGALLEDLGSKNGTILRKSRIVSPTPLSDGDVIEIGPASLVFRILTHTESTASTNVT
jgi:DNA-binding winged helix-turn-helix (wHTH) protein